MDTMNLANWGNFPTARAHIYHPENLEDLTTILQTEPTLLARGNGRCYGDAALADTLVSTLALNRILSFDQQAGHIRCEAGVLLQDLIPIIVPRGWFFPVTPGVKSITVGGAIASDVHGKNHPRRGCFSQWLLSFDLLQSDGSLITCSKNKHAHLFWLTCGGMGLTGIIVAATFQLMPLQTTTMWQHNRRTRNIDELLDMLRQTANWEYAAAWLDFTATGVDRGRGALFLANHHPEGNLEWKSRTTTNISFFLPSWMLNPYSIRMHNAVFYHAAAKPDQAIPMDTYFYPLDRIRHWNRLYGSRGFVQYQCCVPDAAAAKAFKQILDTLQNGKDLPFLSVLKRHGSRPSEAVNSFPEAGFSLALDFPVSKSVPGLVRQLDRIVWEAEGKIYLTKDALSGPPMSRLHPDTFGFPGFDSHLKKRIMP
jgi:FAD/FMN-containing dehydrogenase